MFLRAALVWLLIAVLAILNGGFREGVLRRRLADGAAHLASTILLCAIILAAAWLLGGWIGIRDRGDALAVGTLWLVLTLAFEFLAGHYLFGNPWRELLSEYNVFRGRLWVLVPITTFLAPLLASDR